MITTIPLPLLLSLGQMKRTEPLVYLRFGVLIWFGFSVLNSEFKAQAAQWTVGVYMCADNGMSEQAYQDIAEMMRIGSTSEVNIVVQVDNAARDTNPNCRRYYIQKEHRELLADLGEVDMADTTSLADFIGFLGRRFPASRYLLIIWDHGNGWRAGYGPNRAVLIDESHWHMMGVAGGELNQALRNGVKKLGKKLTVLAFDACLMGCIEVAAEVMSACDYLLASEGMVEWDGLPYDAVLGRLVARPTATPEEFLPEMCLDYVASLPGDDVCLSAINMAQFKRMLKVLSLVLKDSVDPQSAGFRLARLGVQTFAQDATGPPAVEDEQVDFIHFWQLAPATGVSTLRQTLNPLIVANATGGANLANARGIAFWFPYRYLDFKARAFEYQALAFADSAPWLSFLNSYFGMDDVKPVQPKILSHRSGNRGDVRLWWSKAYDLSAVTYTIYQATGIQTVLLEHCDSLGNWEPNGWTLSSRYVHSPVLSFFSGSGSNLNAAIVLNEPLNLSQGGLLSFYALFSTQETEDSAGNIIRDVCYIECSKDRVNWQVLDSLYGSKEFWQEFRYLLPKMTEGYLRFRYKTDGSINRLGVFIDDIKVERFSTLTSPMTTTDTTGYLFNLSRDTCGYYFMVVATDSFGNVANVSQYYPIKVKTWAEPYTRPAPFQNSCLLVLDYPEDEKPDVFIYTLSGTLVKKFPSVETRVIEWNGKNQHGKEIADGIYIVLVQGKRFKKMGKIARVQANP
ncbi:MAG: clostripain-related cysteine peptidase [bacterium]